MPQAMDVNAQFRDADATGKQLIDAISFLTPALSQWWQYSVSHGRFLLCLYSSMHTDNILIGALFASYISGFSYWGHPKLELITGVHEKFHLTGPVTRV
jgi:hypothetical protein